MRSTQLLLAAAAGAVFASTLSAQTITSLVKRNDNVAGVGLVTTLDDVKVNNSGSWLVRADTDAATTEDAVILIDGALYLREDDSVPPPPATISSFGAISYNNAGNVGWNFFLRNLTSSTDSGIYFNKELVVQEGFVSTAPEFSPGTPYIGFFGVKLNNASTGMVVMASIDDPNIATTVDRGLMRYVINPVTGQLVSENVIFKEGDVLPGQTEALTDFRTGRHAYALNDNNDVMFGADLEGDTGVDGVIYINGTLIAQEGSPSPVGGRNWSASGLGSPRLDINNSGGYVHTGTLDGDTASDLVIVRNGAKLVQEGDAVTQVPGGFAFTGFGSGPVDIDDNNNVLWFGAWNGPAGSNNGLFLNDELLVQTGVTVIDGLTLTTLRGIQDGYALSDNGQWAIFRGVLEGGIDGAFMIAIPEPGTLSLAGIAALGLLARRRKA